MSLDNTRLLCSADCLPWPSGNQPCESGPESLLIATSIFKETEKGQRETHKLEQVVLILLGTHFED